MRVATYRRKKIIKFWFNGKRRKLKWAWLQLRYPNCIWVSGCQFYLPVQCENCGEEITKADQDYCTVNDDDLLLCPYCADISNENESRRVWACDNIRGYD